MTNIFDFRTNQIACLFNFKEISEEFLVSYNYGFSAARWTYRQ